MPWQDLSLPLAAGLSWIVTGEREGSGARAWGEREREGGERENKPPLHPALSRPCRRRSFLQKLAKTQTAEKRGEKKCKQAPGVEGFGGDSGEEEEEKDAGSLDAMTGMGDYGSSDGGGGENSVHNNNNDEVEECRHAVPSLRFGSVAIEPVSGVVIGPRACLSLLAIAKPYTPVYRPLQLRERIVIKVCQGCLPRTPCLTISWPCWPSLALSVRSAGTGVHASFGLLA